MWSFSLAPEEITDLRQDRSRSHKLSKPWSHVDLASWRAGNIVGTTQDNSFTSPPTLKDVGQAQTCDDRHNGQAR